MEKKNEIKIFEERKVRTLRDADQEQWYLSIVDVIAVLTDSPNPRKYWSVLKTRLKAEGSQLATNCNQLKMPSADGKFYLADVADTEQRFRFERENVTSSRKNEDRRIKSSINQLSLTIV